MTVVVFEESVDGVFQLAGAAVTPRRSCCSVSRANQRSTGLSREPGVAASA
jgi:hypothetical protein